jgi:hypothetical protein
MAVGRHNSRAPRHHVTTSHLGAQPKERCGRKQSSGINQRDWTAAATSTAPARNAIATAAVTTNVAVTAATTAYAAVAVAIFATIATAAAVAATAVFPLCAWGDGHNLSVQNKTHS